MNHDIIDRKADEVGIRKSKVGNLCNFCENPQDGTYERSGGPEYDDSGYCICGRCLIEISCRFPFLKEFNLGVKMDELYDELPVKLPF